MLLDLTHNLQTQSIFKYKNVIFLSLPVVLKGFAVLSQAEICRAGVSNYLTTNR